MYLWSQRSGLPTASVPAIGVKGLLLLGLLVAWVAFVSIAAPARAEFGLQPDPANPAQPDFHAGVFQADGVTPYTQAAGHPFAATTSFGFNAIPAGNAPDENVKTIRVELPAGFAGNPTAVPQCTFSELLKGNIAGGAIPACPVATQVGITQPLVGLGGFFPPFPLPNQWVFNMVPASGDAATFAFVIQGVIITLHARLKSDRADVVEVTIDNINTLYPLLGSTLTLWGVPAGPEHDAQRGSCLFEGGTCPAATPPKAFLTNPSDCSAGPTSTELSIASWQHPEVFKSYSVNDTGVTGCDKLDFQPTLKVRPTLAQAGAPSGYAVDLDVPQHTDFDQLGTPPIRNAVVTLPKGVALSPSAADGLQGCTDAQIALNTHAASTCPPASKVGTVTINTPLLADPLEGSVFLGQPIPGQMYRIFLEAEGSNVRVKLMGKIDLDPVTGQITTTFENNPQLPFGHLHMTLKGGDHASLVNPPTCGTYTTTGELTPYSAPFTPVAQTTDSFTISRDGQGAPCLDPRTFMPQLTAGTQNPLAGAFSPFSLQLIRSDQDGEFSSLSSLSLPPGLLANVASVSQRCTDAQASAAACPASSHIGEVSVGAGAGPSPFYVAGDVYLTDSYQGSPFGLAVVVHALAGPFDLGYVVVRGAIQVHDDGSVSVATDPFPRILQGIPLQIRDVRVNLDRPGFMFNPTSCNPMSINGTVLSTANQQAGVSSRFQVGECANLAFKPSFTVSTAGKTSKANGASLHVHIATHEGPPSSTSAPRESNIAKVDVQLPVVLPARLPTLQKACTAAQFATDPAGCPVGSFVGTAIAHTPILTSALSGPAILVSHGGQAFPDLVLVLQGEGVRINLTGHTQIKKGITYNHFETVPDAPVLSFDLTLPQGPHAVLTTDVPGRNLCATTRTVTVTKRITRRVNGHNRRVTVKAKKAVAAPLLMPTTMTAQNGAVIHQNTKIAVTGCAKVTKAKKAKGKRVRKGG